jgi:hypothetical protein
MNHVVPGQHKLYNETLYLDQQQNGVPSASPSKVKPMLLSRHMGSSSPLDKKLRGRKIVRELSKDL